MYKVSYILDTLAVWFYQKTLAYNVLYAKVIFTINNQNLHSANIIHIKTKQHMFQQLFSTFIYIFIFIYESH